MTQIVIPGTAEQLEQQAAPWPMRQNPRARAPSELIVPHVAGFDASGRAGTINSAECSLVMTAHGPAIATPRNPTGDPGFNFGKNQHVWGDQRTVAIAAVCNPGPLQVGGSSLLSASNGAFFSLRVHPITRVITARLWNADAALGGYVLPSDGSLVVLVLRMQSGYTTLHANGVLVGSSTATNTWVYSGMYVGHTAGTYNEIDPIRVRWAAGWTSRLSFEEVKVISDDFYGTYFDLGELPVFSTTGGGTVTVQADGTIRWSLVSSIEAAQALRWSLNAAVQRDLTLLWSLLKSVQSDTTARWSLIQAINADAALRWNLVRAVQGDAALSWALLSAVSADSALAWNLAGALGVVSSELALRWSALAPVSVSADLHWHLLNAVAHDIALPWNAVQAIAADGALRWALVQALQADLTAAWRMVTAVSADSVLAWDLAAALGIVAASLDLRWSLIARVQQAVDARWSLLASVGADADMRWDIVAGVVRELTLRWDSVATLIADNALDLSWSLIAVSETDLVLRWQVGEVFDLVVRKRFVAGAATRRIFTAGASTRRSFVA